MSIFLTLSIIGVIDVHMYIFYIKYVCALYRVVYRQKKPYQSITIV